MAGVDAAAWMESFKGYLEPVAKVALDVKDKVGKESLRKAVYSHLHLKTNLYPSEQEHARFCLRTAPTLDFFSADRVHLRYLRCSRVILAVFTLYKSKVRALMKQNARA